LYQYFFNKIKGAEILDEDIKQIFTLKEQGYKRKEIADMLGLTLRQVRRRIEKYNKMRREENERTTSPQSSFFLDETEDGINTYQLQRDKIERHIKKEFPKGNFGILGISDLHVPFHLFEKLKELVNNIESQICVINGDLLDCYSLSQFGKDKFIPLNQEIYEAKQLLEFLSKQFVFVIVTRGNHEKRLSNYLEHQVEPQVQSLTNKSILRVVCSGFDNVLYTDSFWVKIEDTIFGHPSSFSTVPLKTAINMSEFLKNRRVLHKNCIIGHTHKIGDVIFKGVRCMEIGCMCRDLDWVLESGKLTANPWEKGYALLEFKNHELEYNKSRVFILD